MSGHKLQPVRGTKDLLADEARLFSAIVGRAERVSSRYGFEQVMTPIFEFTDVYKRTLGDESDVVSKEMYMLEDRGGESLTLRPEFTAGISRAFISNGLHHQLPFKAFSYGPLFRYERPQKGRQRQFHQLNFELIGAASSQADVELIAMAYHLCHELGIADKVTLEINSLGDQETRDAYRTALVAYFNEHKGSLSEDSLRRLEVNPMRILDSKDDGDKAIVANAPKMADYYSEAAKIFWQEVQDGLKAVGVPFKVNPILVRGLDYYSHTAFEFTTDALGAQNAVLAGGRYDKLIGIMGGPDTPAVGFAGGIERIMALTSLVANKERPVVIVPIGERAQHESLLLAQTLRHEGFFIEQAYSGNIKKRMKKAHQQGALAAIIMGDDELDNKQVNVKDFDSGEEGLVAAADLIDYMSKYR